MNQHTNFCQPPIQEQIRQAHHQMGMPPPMPVQREILQPNIQQQIQQATLPPIRTQF